MNRLLARGVLALLATLLALPAPAAEAPGPLEEVLEESESDEQPQPLVFNGSTIGNPGWVVAFVDGGFYTCAGTLVHPLWVLTAAHCVDQADSGFRVNVGADRWFEGAQRRLSQIHIHPGYTGQLPSVDLAMVRLDAAVGGAPTPNLVSNSSWPALGQALVVLGWGETSTNSPVPSLLQGAGVSVNSDSDGNIGSLFCNASWVAAATGFDDFCFGGSSWACSGDSGGPLVGRSSPQATGGSVNTIYGLTSYGQATGCSTVFWDSMAQGIGPHVGWIRSFFATAETPGQGDEMFFYRSDGLFRYYDVANNGGLSKPIAAGTGYTKDWTTITGVDLDGDGQDEMFFYRNDGLFRYYNVQPNGILPTPMLAGNGYTRGWDAITAIDLDGDGQDEMFFYRNDGLFRYYNIRPDGHIGSPILAGAGYTNGWDAITAIDLDGDGQDEMFFYRNDGLFRYYNIRPDGNLSSPLLQGNGYTTGWDAITAVDLDGDGQDEMFFYRDDGLFRYYNIRPDGILGSPLLQGNGYTTGWDAITAIDLDG